MTRWAWGVSEAVPTLCRDQNLSRVTARTLGRVEQRVLILLRSTLLVREFLPGDTLAPVACVMANTVHTELKNSNTHIQFYFLKKAGSSMFDISRLLSHLSWGILLIPRF